MIFRKIKNFIIIFSIFFVSFPASSGNNSELKKYSNEIEEIKSILIDKYKVDENYADKVFLPFLRRLAKIALPFFEFILLKKPCLFFRFLLLLVILIFIFKYYNF